MRKSIGVTVSAIALTTVSPLSAEPVSANGVSADDHVIVAAGTINEFGLGLQGVKVTAFAHPSNEALDAAGENGLRIIPLDTTTSDQHGAFELAADFSSLPEAYKSGVDRGVDIWLLMSDSGSSLSWWYTLYSVADGGPGHHVAVPAADHNSTGIGPNDSILPELMIDFGLERVVEVGNSPLGWVDTEGIALSQVEALQASTVDVLDDPVADLQRYADLYLAASSGGDPAEEVDPNEPNPDLLRDRCGISGWTSDYRKNRPQHFVNVYSAAGIPVTARQGENGNTAHTLGVAHESLRGGFSASGTTTKSYGTNVVQGNIVNASVKNRVNYRKRVTTCYPGADWLQYSVYDYFTDFRQVAHANAGPYCADKAADSRWETYSASNVTYSAGMDLGPINLSSQAGYGEELDLQFNFNVAGRICGNSSSGPLSSSQVDARRS